MQIVVHVTQVTICSYALMHPLEGPCMLHFVLMLLCMLHMNILHMLNVVVRIGFFVECVGLFTETWKMEEFLALTKEHSLVKKGRALGATGYVHE